MMKKKLRMNLVVIFLFLSLVFFVLFVVAGLYPVTEQKIFGHDVISNLFKQKEMMSLWTTNGIQLWMVRHSEYANVFDLARSFSIVATVFIALSLLNFIIINGIYVAKDKARQKEEDWNY